MAKGIPYDPELKAEIIGKICDEGLSVSAASTQYQASVKSIYAWGRGRRQPALNPGAQLPPQIVRWRCPAFH